MHQHKTSTLTSCFNTKREDEEFLVRSNQAFRGETTLPMGVELPKASTQLKMQELFPEMVEGVQWNLSEGNFKNVLNFQVSVRVAEQSKILDDENIPLTHGVNWNELSKKEEKEEKEALQGELASNDVELLETHEEVSRVHHEEQMSLQQVADLNTRAEQIKASHSQALQTADERSRNLERAKADSEHSLNGEINRLSRQLVIRERPNTPMSAMTRSLPGAGSTNRRGESRII